MKPEVVHEVLSCVKEYGLALGQAERVEMMEAIATLLGVQCRCNHEVLDKQLIAAEIFNQIEKRLRDS